VELNTRKVLLHNIPGVKGSKKVIEGVYWHEGPKSEVRAFLNGSPNSDYQMNEYYGFSSWFEGQLDGEI